MMSDLIVSPTFNNRCRGPALLLSLGALSLGACGQWESFDGSFTAAEDPPLMEAFTGVKQLDHLGLAGVMSRFISSAPDTQDVLVDYDRIHASEEATHLLRTFQSLLAAVNPSDLNSPAERLAYWVNGYNAAVIQGVLSKYAGSPAFKVTDLPFFDQLSFPFGGRTLSLNQVEHGVIRGRFDHESLGSLSPDTREALSRWHQELWPLGAVDPRIHAMLNCAALSCPNLPAASPFVYHASQLEQQMQGATAAWLDNHAKGAGPQGISRLFEWYADDFVASHGSVEAFIQANRTDGLPLVDSTRFLTYDWSLNIARP